MRKIFAWCLAVAVLLSLAGCRGANDALPGSTESTVNTATASVDDAVSSRGTADKELTGELWTGVDEPPYTKESEAYEPDEEVMASHSTVPDGSDPGEPESTAHLFEGYTPMEKNPAQLDEATEEKLIAAYSEEVNEPAEKISITEYYNTYDGVIAVTFTVADMPVPEIFMMDEIGGYTIGYGMDNVPYLYRDGELKDFHDAYDAGWLSDAATKDLAYYYKY